ncbi:hypothetical protein HMPREF9195_01042 [Treponema medium ATCC 700293]|uniref:Uncharacterized protein n=1 Tax=Treponema medium ATCC 700293 TaxID=1125700 RepID=A0AA87NR64_TREMD|nr:hypothetical protein HMPREF9195_01042 [Treponema medium ATCC 700293]
MMVLLNFLLRKELSPNIRFNMALPLAMQIMQMLGGTFSRRTYEITYTTHTGRCPCLKISSQPCRISGTIKCARSDAHDETKTSFAALLTYTS